MQFLIEIDERGFTAYKDTQIIADSRSSNDLLAVLNQVIAASGSKFTVTFVE